MIVFEHVAAYLTINKCDKQYSAGGFVEARQEGLDHDNRMNLPMVNR
jgi:hypothetical protein